MTDVSGEKINIHTHAVGLCWVGGRRAGRGPQMKGGSKSLQTGASAGSWQLKARALSAQINSLLPSRVGLTLITRSGWHLMKDLSLLFLTAVRRKVSVGTEPAARENQRVEASHRSCVQ